MFGSKKRKTTVLYIAIEIEHPVDYDPTGLLDYLHSRIREHTSIYDGRLNVDRAATGISLFNIIKHVSRYGWIEA